MKVFLLVVPISTCNKFLIFRKVEGFPCKFWEQWGKKETMAWHKAVRHPGYKYLMSKKDFERKTTTKLSYFFRKFISKYEDVMYFSENIHKICKFGKTLPSHTSAWHFCNDFFPFCVRKSDFFQTRLNLDKCYCYR